MSVVVGTDIQTKSTADAAPGLPASTRLRLQPPIHPSAAARVRRVPSDAEEDHFGLDNDTGHRRSEPAHLHHAGRDPPRPQQYDLLARDLATGESELSTTSLPTLTRSDGRQGLLRAQRGRRFNILSVGQYDPGEGQYQSGSQAGARVDAVHAVALAP